ncbi:MAG TPA: hypothetical protein DCS66_20360 [Flavobacteriaceae bacterium]|nr:hypothetical protein [Flavobacteriaceae bacterium]
MIHSLNLYQRLMVMTLKLRENVKDVDVEGDRNINELRTIRDKVIGFDRRTKICTGIRAKINVWNG